MDNNENEWESIPQGTNIQFFGPQRTGKTGIALDILEKKLQEGNSVGFIGSNSKHTNVNNKNDALRLIESMSLSRLFDLIIIDSLSALIPEKDLKKMNNFFNSLRNNNHSIIVTNQEPLDLENFKNISVQK